MKKTKYLFFFIVARFTIQTAVAQSGLFKINVSYTAARECSHKIMGDPEHYFSHSGVGFLWEGEYIISAYHLFANSCPDKRITVIAPDGMGYEAYFIGGETLFDIAVLQLCSPVDELNSYSFADQSAQVGASVEIMGFQGNSYRPSPIPTRIDETKVCMPGCFGSHKLAVSTTEGFSGGYSGSPVLHRGKVVGMATGSGQQDATGYFIEADILKKAIRQIIRYNKMQRRFTATVWARNEQGVILKDILDERAAATRPYIGLPLKTANGQPIKDLSDLRSVFEVLHPNDTAPLRLVFDAPYGEKSVLLPTYHLFVDDFEHIADFFMQKNILPFRLQNPYNNLVVDDVVGTSNIQSGDTFSVVGLPQIKAGIGCNDIFDLGLVLKTFSPTNTKLTLFFNNRKHLQVDMPEWLFN